MTGNKFGYAAFALAAVALVLVLQKPKLERQGSTGSAFEHVMQTRTLRCSYSPLSPFLTVDPTTKKIGGLFRDVMDEIGQRLNIKIDWVEEVGYGQISTGFLTGRYDAFCSVLWATPARGTAMNFTSPLYYNRVSPCVRADTTAYDQSVEGLNAPDKTLIAYDGDVSEQVTRTLFPRAKLMIMSENMSFGEAMQNITTGKADALATCDRTVVDDLNKTGNTLKLAAPQNPITTMKVALALPLHDEALKNMIDLAIFDIQADGTLKKMMTQAIGQDRMNDTVIIPAVTSGVN